MTGGKDRERLALNRLADALVEDVLNTSDEDILAELRDEGVDPHQFAASMQARFELAVIKANKAKLIEAKAAVAADHSRLAGSPRAPIDMADARRRLRQAMASQPLTLAARNETDMSDSDVLGMLEDLQELGALPLDNKT